MKKYVFIGKRHKQEPLKLFYERFRDSLEGWGKVIKRGDTVLIKPNLVAPIEGAYTSIDLLRFVIEDVKKIGATPIIADSSGYEFNTRNTLKVLKLNERLNCKIINLDEQPYRKIKGFNISRLVFDANKIINIPRLKKHGLTLYTGAAKNLLGLIDRKTRRKIHASNINQGIYQLTKLIRPDLNLIDGTTIMTRAAFSQERQFGVLLASRSIWALDFVGASLLGINYQDIGYFPQNFNPQKIKIIGGPRPEVPNRKRKSLEQRAYEAAFKLCYNAENLFSFFNKTASLIPYIHWYLGIRPVLMTKSKKQLEKINQICPVRAIDLKKGKINRDKCMQVRCLKCYKKYPNLIKLVGLRKNL